jgi:hypothetical protein
MNATDNCFSRPVYRLARELLAIGSASCARLTWFGVLWYANAVPAAAGLNMAQRVLSSAVLHRPPMPGNEHVRHTASSTLICKKSPDHLYLVVNYAMECVTITYLQACACHCCYGPLP